MAEHYWGDEKFDWKGLDDAADYISVWLIRWMRQPITQVKEKFGTLRIYCGFGWDTFHTIIWPRHCWIHKWWPYKLDLWISYNTPVLKWLNSVVIPVQQKAYAWRYKKAVQKWPHLYDEIVSMADFGELFDGVVPGYKHSNYWQEMTNEEKES